MATVYKIVDSTNVMVYVGVTRKPLWQRLNEHFSDARKDSRKHRKLYCAINEKGEDKFSIYKVEDCADKDCFEREKYWISKYDSYQNGYNGTYGGTGRHQKDYQSISEKYKSIKNIKRTALVLGVDVSTVKKALIACEVSIVQNADVVRISCGRKIGMFDLNGQYQQSFRTVREAAEAVSKTNVKDIDGVVSHIVQVCNGKRKTAYKHTWKYEDLGA